MKYIKIWGLQHTATNYMEEILEKNFTDVTLLINRLGWKHGNIPFKINWDGSDWTNDLVPLKERKVITDELVNSIIDKKDEIQRLYDNNQIYNVIIIKDVFDWFNSSRIRRKGLNHLTFEDTVKLWNDRLHNYFEFQKLHPDNTIIISYYRLRNDYVNVMVELAVKFGLTPKSNTLYNFSTHIGNNKQPVFGSGVKIYDYPKVSNNFVKNVELTKQIRKYVDNSMYKKYLDLSIFDDNNITYAYLETTNYCNLNCSFCNRLEVIKGVKHIELGDWVKLLDKIDNQPIVEAKLMGMGEPFLHPEYDKILIMFNQRFPACFVISSTNGHIRVDDKFKNSLKYIDLLYISIDGYEDTYELNRPPAKWNLLIKFLEGIKDINRYGCRFAINYTVNKNNIHDLPKVRLLLEKYNLDEFRINLVQSWDEDGNLTGNEYSEYSEEDLNYLKENYRDEIRGKSPWTWSDCFWVKNGLYITVDGDVKMCALNTSATECGNIFESDINDIRNTECYLAIKNGCIIDNPTSHCKNCSYKELSPILGKIL